MKKELFYQKNYLQVWLKLSEEEKQKINVYCKNNLISKNSYISNIVKNYLLGVNKK